MFEKYSEEEDSCLWSHLFLDYISHLYNSMQYKY